MHKKLCGHAIPHESMVVCSGGACPDCKNLDSFSDEEKFKIAIKHQL